LARPVEGCCEASYNVRVVAAVDAGDKREDDDDAEVPMDVDGGDGEEPKKKKKKKVVQIKGLKLNKSAGKDTENGKGAAGGKGGGAGGGDMSVDEWNAQRAALGLKPLK
jgi:hypothetical protein